jgi:hypothetical protein
LNSVKVIKDAEYYLLRTKTLTKSRVQAQNIVCMDARAAADNRFDSGVKRAPREPSGEVLRKRS